MQSRLEELKTRLSEIEEYNEDYDGQIDEMRHRIIVDLASSAADEIIMEGSDGSVEETDYLTSAVAQVMNNRVHQAIMSKLLRKKLLERFNDK